MTQFVFNNLAQMIDPSESLFDVTIPMFHSVFREDVEKHCKKNFYPDEHNFVFSNMTQMEDEGGMRLVNPEFEDEEDKNLVVQTNDEYDTDQVLISQQASTIEQLQKEIAELKK